MGAQASTNVNTIKNDLVTSAFNTCPSVSASNTINLNSVQFRPDMNPNCKTSSLNISQTSGVESTCLISSLQDSLAKTISQMDAKTQGGLGLQASTNIADISNQLSQNVENSCGSQSATNAASISDTTITACDWHFVQNATAQSACTINALQKMANDVTSKQTSDATGMTLASFLFGYSTSIAIVMGIVIVIIVAGVLYYYFGSGNKTDDDRPLIKIIKQTGGWFSFGNVADDTSFLGGIGKRQYSIMIISLLILVAIFILNSRHSNLKITKRDLKSFGTIIKDARKIAGISTDSDFVSPNDSEFAPSSEHDNENLVSVHDKYFPGEPLPMGSYNDHGASIEDFYKPLV